MPVFRTRPGVILKNQLIVWTTHIIRTCPTPDAAHGYLMSQPNSNPKKPEFIGENPHWGRTTLTGFTIVAIVLTSIILFFR